MAFSEAGVKKCMDMMLLLRRIDPKHIPVLYRIAKHPHKGLRPFFKEPYAMMALRNEANRIDQ